MSTLPPEYEDEQKLIRECRRGNRRAQETFYRRYAPVGLSVCRRYANTRAEAMELLNEGMMKVFDRLGDYRFEGSLEGWIKRLIFTSTVDQFRRQRRRPTLEIADWDQPAEASVTQELYAEDLHRLINQLPETSKEVFWLYAVEGYKHAEIAARLGFTEATSRWHLNQARKVLRAYLATEPLKYHRHAG